MPVDRYPVERDPPGVALRCPRCQQNEIALETFGVYRCPACGRIDADGHVLDPASASPVAVTFAPPPPRAWIPPGAPAPAEPAAATGPPGFFLAMLALDAILIVTAAAATRSAVRAFVGLAFLVPLLTGRPGARAISLLGATVEIGFCTLVLAMAHQLSAFARGALVLDVVLQLVWIYTLFRADTVGYFARRR